MKRPESHSSSKVAEELRLINVRHHGSSRETSMVDERLVEPLRLRVEFEDWRRPWRDMAAAAAAAATIGRLVGGGSSTKMRANSAQLSLLNGDFTTLGCVGTAQHAEEAVAIRANKCRRL